MKTTSLKRIGRLTMELLRDLASLAAYGLNSQPTLQLAAAPAGRIVLHTLCAVRGHRFGWHWRRVAREFALL